VVPLCNLALRAYQDDLVPTRANRGIPLVAISPQKPDGSLSVKEKNELTFTVLSDPGSKIAGRLGVVTAPTEDAEAAQRSFGIDMPDADADGTHDLPMPTVVIVDGTGVIRWIDCTPTTPRAPKSVTSWPPSTGCPEPFARSRGRKTPTRDRPESDTERRRQRP
jgi:peroxiredoxin